MSSVNISNQNVQVNPTTTENKINVVTTTENNISVTQPSIQTFEILTGPQGPAGPSGSQGPQGDSFPYTGSAVITGSLTVTGSIAVSSSLGSLNELGVADSSGLTSINFSSRRLKDTNGINVVDWQTNLVKDRSNINSFHWSNRLFYDVSGSKSIDWAGRTLLQSDGSTITIDWENGIFTGSLYGTSSYADFAESASYALTASYLDSYVPPFPFSGSAIITGSLLISSSTNQQLTLIGSGSDQPIFRVQGSAGELFSISDSLSGSLFAVNNISGLPILEVFSDDRIIQGDYTAPMLTTTVKNTVSSIGAFTVYELPTSSYDGAFFEYVAKSGSDARAGQIMSLWSGSSVNFTETTTTDFGNTSGLSFIVTVTGSNFALTGSVTTANWTIKTIVRSI